MQWKDYQKRLSNLSYRQIPKPVDEEEPEPDVLFLSPKVPLKRTHLLVIIYIVVFLAFFSGILIIV